MAYMMMLTLNDADQLDSVLSAWREIGIDHVTYVECACSRGNGQPRPHIPMRFLLEGRAAAGREPILTAFAIAPDEDAVYHCISLAEAVAGDFDESPHSTLSAWPLPILAGYPKRAPDKGLG
jgi:hypothetical protein